MAFPTGITPQCGIFVRQETIMVSSLNLMENVLDSCFPIKLWGEGVFAPFEEHVS